MNDRSQYALSDGAPERSQPPPKDPLDRGLPASIDAERSILGAILLSNDSWNEAAEVLVAEDFSLDSHRRIFQRMEDLIESGHTVDIVTLAEELARRKEVEAIGGVAYLAGLTEGLPRRISINEYVLIVKQKSQLRRMIGICSNVITRSADQSETPMGIIEDAESELLEIAQESNVGKLKTIADSVNEAGGVDPYMRPITDPKTIPGLATGFTELDSMTGGFKPAEMIVIAARPAQGKSALMLDIAQNVCMGTDNVAGVFSLEMSRGALEKRLLASRAMVDVRRATSGQFLSTLEREKLAGALEDLLETKLFIDDSSALTPVQLRAKARRLKQRMGRLDLILIDYLQLLSGGRKFENRQTEVGYISRSLKGLSKELEVPVVALAQVGRSSEQRQDKRPTLADLRESGNIEADADVVIFVHRDSYYRPDDEDCQGLADLVLAKQREGPTGTIKLVYLAQMTKFTNLARGY